MSKPVVRVILAVLISLAVIAAIAPGVQARLGDVLSQTQMSAADSSLGRISLNARAGSYYQFQDYYKDSSGGCDHSDSSTDD